jgi:rhodanese-related sulfurtransferase
MANLVEILRSEEISGFSPRTEIISRDYIEGCWVDRVERGLRGIWLRLQIPFGIHETGFVINRLSMLCSHKLEAWIMNKIILFLGFLLVVGFHCMLAGNAFAQEPKRILSIEAYDMLNTVPDTYLLDVRTRAEYQFVGHPISAYLFPYMFMTAEFGKSNDTYGYRYNVKNKSFVEEISKVFKKTDNLLVLCRDGTRSALAAKDLINAGFKNAFNVEDGFEGAEFPTFNDSNKHKFYRQLAKRSKVYGFNHRRHYGWQWWGLPWVYEIDPKYIYPPDLTPSKK